MAKDTSVRKSVIFTIIELGIFIALCMIQAAIIPSQQNQAFFVRLTINFLAGYLALIAAIATTWYVVFTYYLMKSTIEFNQQMATPFANISWEICSGEPDYKAEGQASAERMAVSGGDQVAPTAVAESRWAVLIITNARFNPIDKVVVPIRVTGESESWFRKPYVVEFNRQHLRIERDRSIRIGVVDLLQVPRDVMLVMEILDFSYQANDSTDNLRESRGERIYSVRGLGMIVPGSSLA